MLNSEKFIKAFSAIENRLRILAGVDKFTPFYDLIEKASKTNAVVRNLEKDLREYGDLRNAIVHERSGGYVLAEPNERAVNDIESIASLLLKPSLVFPLFQKQVTVLASSESIGIAVKLMWEYSYSQIPIRDNNKFIGLLTTNTITRWLGASAEEDVFSLKDTSIANVLKHAEDQDNFAFLGKTSFVADAIEIFQNYERQGKNLDAILLTELGRPTEKFIGIVTLSDLPTAFRQISKTQK